MVKFLLVLLLIYGKAFAHLPKVSIITSLYNANHFIDSFLQNIIKQTIFIECELIIINANSPENEDIIIEPYLKKYSNIIYVKLDHDPGLYGVWNSAIKIAQADYIINANVDDGLKHNALEVFAHALDINPNIDMVYSDVYMTNQANTSFDLVKKKGVTKLKQFSKESMIMCPPLNHPMWRKSIHSRFGFFDETYKSAGDFEMWLRAVKNGSTFLKLDGVYGYFYMNANGLSHGKKHVLEIEKILFQYRTLFNFDNLTKGKIMLEYHKAAAQSFIWY